MFKWVENLKRWPMLQQFSFNLNTCLKYEQNMFKNYFESVLAGALISLLVCFVYGLTCPNNIFQYFVRACASLGLTSVYGHLVLFLGLIMVCLDGLILLCLTLFKHCKTTNTVIMILFMGNVSAMITAGLPLFWEANTEGSFAMCAWFKNSPVFWIYAAFIGLSLTYGVIMLRPYVIKPYVLFVQALCIIVSDVAMFLAGFFGFPTGVLTNICVYIFFAGLGLRLSQVYEHHIRVWVQKAPFKWLMPNQKTDFAPALFGFLASSRLLSWALASVYGPTNWCASVKPKFCNALFFIVCVVWQFTSVKLLAASLNPINSARFIPFEPVLVYNRLGCTHM